MAAGAGLAAGSAYAGAVAIAAGHLMPADDLGDQLPLARPLVRAVALAVMVGAPFTLLAWYAWRGDRRSDLLSLIAGEMTCGWIVVELALVRSPTLLEVVFVPAAIASLLAGREAVATIIENFRSERERLR